MLIILEAIKHSLVPTPIPSFSMLHAENIGKLGIGLGTRLIKHALSVVNFTINYYKLYFLVEFWTYVQIQKQKGGYNFIQVGF